ATGLSRLVMVARKASASFSTAVCLAALLRPFLSVFLAASAAPTAVTAQATRIKGARIQDRMLETLPQTLGHRQRGRCVVTDRALMRATLIVLLCSAFLGFGCKQGAGVRCVQDSDCETGHCMGAGVQGGHCAATTTGGTQTGTGGSTGEGGQGAAGDTGQGGAGQDGSASDAQAAADASLD